MNEDGPSKNELKKLAKKAEKMALKKDLKADITGESAQVAVVVEEPKVASTASTMSWSIAFPESTKESTIKPIWVAQAFGIDLKLASRKSVTTNPGLCQTALTTEGGDVLVTEIGGNAMAIALSCLKCSTSTTKNFMEQCWVDEWCEWERTTLCHCINDSKMKDACWKHLEESLQAGSSPCYLVGSTLSVADICIATTIFLASADEDLHKYPALQLFLNSHKKHFEKAVEQARSLQEQHDRGGGVDSATIIDMDESSLQTVVDTIFRGVVEDLFGEYKITLPQNVVKPCSNPKHGDFQLSAAMPIFAVVKGATYKSPPDVAHAIIEAIGDNHPVLTNLQIQGPGFVLCKLHASYLQHHVNIFLQSGILAMPRHEKPGVCVVDFSSPNIAKEMHVGHLRSTIIGEAVCRVMEAAGHKVHRVNHVGDWGTQFGMLIQYLREEYPDVVNSDTTELPNITDLTVFYKNAKARFDESADFKKQSQLNVVDLQSGNPDCLKIWKMLCDVSRREFQKIYTRLDIHCEEYGESFYNERIPPVVEEFTEAGKIKIEEGGAKCVWNDQFPSPLMLQKSDGGYGYDSTDMAALRYRLFDLNADRIIIITDSSQSDHFKMIFAAGRDIGWLNREQRLDHIGFGTVMGEDGKRFKTRSGDTVRLVDLLDEAVLRMEESLRERITEGKSNITADEVHEVAEAIGYGAVKYFDLRRNPTSNYKFSYDQMLNTKGDTAVYLLYARVRLESIVAKAAAEHGVVVDELLKKGTTITIGDEYERNLALQLQMFTDTIEQTLDDLYPCHICEYIYKLATAASDFVTQCRVLGSPEMESRILMCHATCMAMHQCFDLLGIRHVKRI